MASIASAAATTSPTAAPTVAPTSPPLLPIDFCFNMGPKPGIASVIKNGNVTNQEDQEFNLFSVFYAWLDDDHPIINCSGLHNWTVKDVVPPPGGLIQVAWKQDGDGKALPLNATNVTSEALTIDWTCAPEAKQFNGIVEVYIALTGYSEIVFSLNKTCFPHITHPPTPGAPSTGWGAGSIFFFTVFILTMVFCIVGCGINYVQQGKTGLEIIPGASTCVACLGKLFRQPRYTPQMDYDAPVGGQATGNERFGASYQTDL